MRREQVAESAVATPATQQVAPEQQMVMAVAGRGTVRQSLDD